MEIFAARSSSLKAHNLFNEALGRTAASSRTMPMNTRSVGKIQRNYIPASSRTMPIESMSTRRAVGVEVAYINCTSVRIRQSSSYADALASNTWETPFIVFALSSRGGWLIWSSNFTFINQGPSTCTEGSAYDMLYALNPCLRATALPTSRDLTTPTQPTESPQPRILPHHFYPLLSHCRPLSSYAPRPHHPQRSRFFLPAPYPSKYSRNSPRSPIICKVFSSPLHTKILFLSPPPPPLSLPSSVVLLPLYDSSNPFYPNLPAPQCALPAAS